MPVEKVDGGWRWGEHGKVYARRWKAERQGRAIEFAKHAKKDDSETDNDDVD